MVRVLPATDHLQNLCKVDDSPVAFKITPAPARLIAGLGAVCRGDVLLVIFRFFPSLPVQLRPMTLSHLSTPQPLQWHMRTLD
jgi:hypothetical protein